MVGDKTLARLQDENPRYSDTAYLFVLTALQYVIDKLEEPRHIDGQELARGCRDLAIERFGPMARTVLEHWGIHSTCDVGEIVYGLIECRVLTKQESDSRSDFLDVFDFEEAFERNYPWGRVRPKR